MTSTDLAVTAFYLLLILFFSKTIISKKYSNDPVKKYFLPALFLRIFGGIMADDVFRVGDTRVFFARGRQMYLLLTEDFTLGLALLMPELGLNHVELPFWQEALKTRSSSNYFTSRISGIVSVFTLGSRYGNNILFATISFYGAWKFFNVMRTLYPQLTKQFAWFILLLPSLLLWSSPTGKDSLTMAGVFIILAGMIRLFLLNDRRAIHVINIILWTFIVVNVKSYVLYTLFPGLMLYVFLEYKNKLSNPGMRRALTPVVLIGSFLATILIMTQLQGYMGKYSLENLEGSAAAFQRWHTAVGHMTQREVSFYSIGNTGDFSPGNLIQVFPAAVNVTFFRPYLWEVKTLGQLLTSLESLFFLLYTLWVFKKVGVGKALNLIGSKPLIMFCMAYALVFGFAVGFISLNFGALARYKIPALSLYLIGITLIYYYGVLQKRKKSDTEKDENEIKKGAEALLVK